MARRPKKRPQTKPSSTPDAGRRLTTGRRWILAFVLATAVAYASSLAAPFEYDDLRSIQGNASIHSASPAEWLQPPPLTPVAGRPVVNVSFALNHFSNEILGVDQSPDPGGPRKTVVYHLTSVILHVLCGLLIFAIIGRTIAGPGATTIAGVTTLLWLVHPIQTDAVIYLTQRTEILVSLFYAATLYASIRAWDAGDTRRRWWYAAGVIACAAGMGSKEVMITAPLMVILYDRAFHASSWRELFANRGRVAFYGALAATSLIVIASVLSGQRSQSAGLGTGVPWYSWLNAQGWAIMRYLRLIVLPTGLTFDYGEFTPVGMRGIPGLVILALLGVATAYAWTRARPLGLAFLGAWFFLLLAPSSSVIPIRTEMAAERRIYLASAAVFLLVVFGARALLARFGAGALARRAIATAVVVVLLTTTFLRGRTYESPEVLYRDTIAKAPRNPRAHIGLGLALLQQGPARADEAASHFHDAIAVDSSNIVAWRTLGVLESMRGNWKQASLAFREVLRTRPDNTDAIDGMGRALLHLGDPDAARPYVDQMGTRDLELLWLLSDLLVQRRRGKEAIPYLEAAMQAQRPPALGIALLSMAYAQGGRPEDAVKAASYAARAAGDTAAVLALAGHAMLAIDRTADARDYFSRALSIDPALQTAREGIAAARGRR